MGQQDLGDVVAVLGKAFIVKMHQLALAHSGGGLLKAQLGGPLLHAELLRADADGGRGDQHHFIAAVLAFADHPGQVVDGAQVEPAVVWVRVEVPTLTTTRLMALVLSMLFPPICK